MKFTVDFNSMTKFVIAITIFTIVLKIM